MAQVLWRDAQGNEGSIELTDGEAQIGRAMDCAIRTDDGLVSRYHARISHHAGAYTIEDLDSANGIFVHEQRVTRHILRHGDAVRCGSLWLRFVNAATAGQKQALPQSSSTGKSAGGKQPSTKSSRAKTSPEPSDTDEVRRLQRRIDQLQAELRIYRGGGAKALKIEELERDHRAVQEERDALKLQVEDLKSQIKAEGADAKVHRADQIRDTAADLVGQLNDLLSDLRINVTAAEGEFDLFADAIPKASFELIREALRTAATDLDKTRDLLRELRSISS